MIAMMANRTVGVIWKEEDIAPGEVKGEVEYCMRLSIASLKKNGTLIPTSLDITTHKRARNNRRAMNGCWTLRSLK